eukprot:1349620-Amorphochlora_amoeboformis.AAC.1
MEPPIPTLRFRFAGKERVVMIIAGLPEVVCDKPQIDPRCCLLDPSGQQNHRLPDGLEPGAIFSGMWDAEDAPEEDFDAGY